VGVNRRAIEVQIDELVLHGFTPRERYAIAEAIQRELTALLKTRGLPGGTQHLCEREALRAPPATLRPSRRADETGTAIARAIYGGLTA
jgi:hypothetical protein